ncbi:MAG: hypothetical protein JWP01_1099 [Myxococcales bacterium]|nr:hypothetical protein [Myxococcales bacterium]
MKKTLLVLALVSTGTYAAWRWQSSPEPKAAASVTATDRIWIDHLPTSERDTFHVFAAITEEPIGIFQATSQWKGNFEMFRHETHGDTIKAVYPQDKSREEIKVKATECKELREMDYCLEMHGASRGVKKYYSRKGWEIDGVHDAAELARRGEAAVQQLTAGE